MNAQNLVKTLALKGVAAGMLIGLPRMIYAADIVVPPAPCHPNPNAATDGDTVMNREDIKDLPDPLKDRLVALAKRPHSILPVQAYAEAGQENDPTIPDPSQLFQYYLLDEKGFEPNVFISQIPGVNETAMLTVTGADCGLTPLSAGQGPVKNIFPTIGAVRLVVEPKKVPKVLPTDPNDPGAFIDIFTDISGLFVINNESGWYEGWMIHDLRVADIEKPRSDGHAQFGKITREDAEKLAMMGAQNGKPGNNTPGNFFTIDGEAPHFPRKSDHFPINKRMWCRFNSVWVLTTHSSKVMLIVTGSSITPRTGSIPSMSYLLPGDFQINSAKHPTPLKRGKLVNYNRSSLVQDQMVYKTNPKTLATIRTFHVTPINSMPTLTHSGSFANASFRADWPEKYFWMSSSG